MTKIAMQFCPSCGRYWVPASVEEAAQRKLQRCKTCNVQVGLSWLGHAILGVVLYLLLATDLVPLLNRAAPWVLVFLLCLAALKAMQQHRAVKRRRSREQKDAGKS